MTGVGGYFELELWESRIQRFKEGIMLRCGRDALQFIIKEDNIKRLYVPYFICQVVVNLLEGLSIEIVYYHVGEDLESVVDFEIGEYILLVNYFGLKREYVKKMSKLYGAHLIVDNSHDLFCPSSVTEKSWMFNSFRKFFGVPDGAQVLPPKGRNLGDVNFAWNLDASFVHLIKRKMGLVNEGYKFYQENESRFIGPIKGINPISIIIMNSIDFELVCQTRRDNFEVLHARLKSKNRLSAKLTDIKDHVPFSYPLFQDQDDLMKEFWSCDIFIPYLWPKNGHKRRLSTLEEEICQRTLHLPIDHRYNEGHMIKIIQKVLEIVK